MTSGCIPLKNFMLMKKTLRLSLFVILLTVVIYKIHQAQQNKQSQTDLTEQTQTENPDISATGKSKRKVQVAIILDTSNSMDGLIEQAKSRLWDIVNTLSTLYYEDRPANFEIALYQYGNDNLSPQKFYIQKIKSFSTNLDAISESLFGLRTLGGEEYCGAVLSDAHSNLEWSKDPNDIKLIYIAGNEPFDQGPKDYKQVIKQFKKDNDIQINTIFCGVYDEGKKTHWANGADLGGGKYFAINSDNRVHHVATPYDDSIIYCNQKLNDTYLAYGHNKNAKKNFMLEQDNKASSSSKETLTKRAISKSKKSVYKNESWDLVDAYEMDEAALESIEDQELPDELQGLTKAEQKAKIKEVQMQREDIQKEIAKYNRKRLDYISTHTTGDKKDDFGTALVHSIESIAKSKGYELREQ